MRKNPPFQNLAIRPISGADAVSVRKLYAESLKSNPRGFIQDPLFHGDIAGRAQAYQAEQGAMLGIFSGRELAGFGALKRKDAARVELCHLHLREDYQGLGLGRKLSTALIEEAKALGYHTVELHVTATQKPALGLYQKLGFVQTRREVYRHADGQSFDTVFMELKI